MKTESMDLTSHLGVLRRYALVLTRDPGRAEDLVQEAVLRALEGASTWREGGDLRKWLLAIVHNAHVSRCRRLKTEREAEATLASQPVGPQSAPQAAHVDLGQTMNALMGLPEEQREVLMLVAIEGMSYRDAAECLDIPVGTLMSRLGRARAALRAAADRTAAPEASAAPHLRLVR